MSGSNHDLDRQARGALSRRGPLGCLLGLQDRSALLDPEGVGAHRVAEDGAARGLVGHLELVGARLGEDAGRDAGLAAGVGDRLLLEVAALLARDLEKRCPDRCQ